MTFDLAAWYADFIEWMRLRSDEVIEIISDCSNELFLNALTAQHLRVYGRKHQLPLFWARSEWYKTDTSVGQATERFKDWNRAWPNQTGDICQIEAKLTYSSQAPSQRREAFRVLRSELEERKARDTSHPVSQQYLGLIWHLAYTPGKQIAPSEWAELCKTAGMEQAVCPPGIHANQSGFVSLGQIDLTPIWPHNYECRAELTVTLRPWTAVGD